MREVWDLLIIDPNNGFLKNVNYTPNLPGGDMNLCIPGALDTADTLANLIRRSKDKFNNIRVTLDSHHPIHIATPIFFKDRQGKHPRPYTLITLEDIKNGIWSAAMPQFQRIVEHYVATLKTNKRYVLMIWPPHCIIGTEGHLPYAPIRESLLDWEADFNIVDWLTKGSNPFTEHYSAVKADVEDPKDLATMLQVDFIQKLENADRVFVAGWALDFCVANTVRDIVYGLQSIDLAKKFTILEDCTASVNAPGLEHLGPDFVKEMKGLGVNFENSKNAI